MFYFYHFFHSWFRPWLFFLQTEFSSWRICSRVAFFFIIALIISVGFENFRLIIISFDNWSLTHTSSFFITFDVLYYFSVDFGLDFGEFSFGVDSHLFEFFESKFGVSDWRFTRLLSGYLFCNHFFLKKNWFFGWLKCALFTEILLKYFGSSLFEWKVIHFLNLGSLFLLFIHSGFSEFLLHLLKINSNGTLAFGFILLRMKQILIYVTFVVDFRLRILCIINCTFSFCLLRLQLKSLHGLLFEILGIVHNLPSFFGNRLPWIIGWSLNHMTCVMLSVLVVLIYIDASLMDLSVMDLLNIYISSVWFNLIADLILSKEHVLIYLCMTWFLIMLVFINGIFGWFFLMKRINTLGWILLLFCKSPFNLIIFLLSSFFNFCFGINKQRTLNFFVVMNFVGIMIHHTLNLNISSGLLF